ncbi:MAG TPA: hypothetical protein VIQ31_12210 [Phormidium sp.]
MSSYAIIVNESFTHSLSRVTHGFIHPVVRLIRSAAVGRSDRVPNPHSY